MLARMATKRNKRKNVRGLLAGALQKGNALCRRVFNRATAAKLLPLFVVLFMVGAVIGFWRATPSVGPDVKEAEPAAELTSPAAVSLDLQSLALTEKQRFERGLEAALREEPDRPGNPVSEKDFIPPCPGRVSEPFGWRRDAELGVWKLHAGVFLGAARRTPVVAIAPGKVARVEQDSLHGVLVAVDHDSHWRSVYGRLSEVTVVPGDAVTAGQVLARVGNGPEGGYGLYFALYRDGEPQDPQVVIPGL